MDFFNMICFRSSTYFSSLPLLCCCPSASRVSAEWQQHNRGKSAGTNAGGQQLIKAKFCIFHSLGVSLYTNRSHIHTCLKLVYAFKMAPEDVQLIHTKIVCVLARTFVHPSSEFHAQPSRID